jgi:hypothetical protein
MWGQHPALGAPFVEAGCRIDLPAARVNCANLSPVSRFGEGTFDWPYAAGKAGGKIDLRHVPGIEADTTDTLRLTDIAEGWYAVRNERLDVGFGMCWPLSVFPVLWFWQAYGGAYGAPWYGRTYIIALEPFSIAQPTVVDAIKDGTARIIQPGETVQASFVVAGFEGSGEVTGISADGRITRA